MIVIVNDANILIDLVKLKLLPQFFGLECNFYTSDIILDELHQGQKQELQAYISNGRLTVIGFNDNELIDIAMLKAQRPQLSEQDCSAIVCAKKIGGGVLTSDNTLRKFAKSKSLEVHGHLWIFDQMIVNNKITTITATQKLRELVEVVNTKLCLPKVEVENRFNSWSK